MARRDETQPGQPARAASSEEARHLAEAAVEELK
jgi:hypothetical protein